MTPPPVNALWGARCGKSARRVLTGGTSPRSHAGSVRPAARKRRLRQGSAKATASRLVSTGHTIRHSILLDKIAKRVQDPEVVHLIKQIIKAAGKIGVPQGGPFSPLAANIYLTEIAWMFDAIRRKTAQGPYEAVNYHRFADDSAPRRREGVFMI
jgi:hypothetical protein